MWIFASTDWPGRSEPSALSTTTRTSPLRVSRSIVSPTCATLPLRTTARFVCGEISTASPAVMCPSSRSKTASSIQTRSRSATRKSVALGSTDWPRETWDSTILPAMGVVTARTPISLERVAAERAHALLGGVELGPRARGRGARELGVALRRDARLGELRLALLVRVRRLGVRARREHRGLRLAEVGALELGERVARLHRVAGKLEDPAHAPGDARADGGDALGIERDRAGDVDDGREPARSAARRTRASSAPRTRASSGSTCRPCTGRRAAAR